MSHANSFDSPISRRTFLKGAAAASGGLIIAIHLPGCGRNDRASSGPAKTVEANAWLRIGTDNSITVLCDRSEMGQGVYTALPDADCRRARRAAGAESRSNSHRPAMHTSIICWADK